MRRECMGPLQIPSVAQGSRSEPVRRRPTVGLVGPDDSPARRTVRRQRLCGGQRRGIAASGLGGVARRRARVGARRRDALAVDLLLEAVEDGEEERDARQRPVARVDGLGQRLEPRLPRRSAGEGAMRSSARGDVSMVIGGSQCFESACHVKLRSKNTNLDFPRLMT